MKFRQSGTAAIELALVLPLLLAITFGITEFGRAIVTYNTLTKAARDAARYLSMQQAGNTAAYAAAKTLAVYGNPAGSGSPLLPGLATSMIDICDASISTCTNNINQGSAPSINTVTVTISGYTFNPVIDLLSFTSIYSGGTSSITSINFNPISVTMRQS